MDHLCHQEYLVLAQKVKRSVDCQIYDEDFQPFKLWPFSESETSCSYGGIASRGCRCSSLSPGMTEREKVGTKRRNGTKRRRPRKGTGNKKQKERSAKTLTGKYWARKSYIAFTGLVTMVDPDIEVLYDINAQGFFGM